jgi:POT family proton-dependent oligopeptide transporter
VSNQITPPQRTFLGHPIGLYVLFFTEMWERFSYYGMRALLILYMVNYFKWSQEESSSVYKWYTSLVYLTPIAGGFLADRFLGNKRAVLIGAVLMAIGHFLMAFEAVTIFYSALVFLILGNGMFKPNMSTQVGRLYPPGDPRRDGAYTIFYMGINLGAFASPLLCGWLAENTRWSYHAGFTVAGIGMLFGLVIYLFGQPLVKELPQDVPHAPTPPVPEAVKDAVVTPALAPVAPLSESEAERTPSAMRELNAAAPKLLVIAAALLAVAGPALAWIGVLAWDSAIGMGIAAGAALIAAWVCTQVHNAVRDRILAIMALGIFVVVFWAAAEQAGNTLNVWADQTTDRYLTHAQPPVPTPPAKQPKADAGWLTFLNPVPTAWFQSINALGIFVMAPLFAWWWTYNEKRGRGTSIATKIVFGLTLAAVSLFFMVGGAWREDQPTQGTTKVASLPAGVEESDGKLRPAPAEEGKKPGTPYQQGRLNYDGGSQTLSMSGVLANVERDRIVRDTAPRAFKDLAAFLEVVTERLEKGKETTAEVEAPSRFDPTKWLPDATVVNVPTSDRKPDDKREKYKVTASLPLTVHLVEVPKGFDLSLAGFEQEKESKGKDVAKVTYDTEAHTLTVNEPLADKDVKSLLVCAGEPEFRSAVYELYAASAKYRVSASWLFWFYVLATVGELYLSPVGLSMVSKLAPAKYATMLMGLWMLTSFFGNFLAGMAGEEYDKIPPLKFFLILTLVLAVVAAGGYLIVRKVTALMHGVK